MGGEQREAQANWGHIKGREWILFPHLFSLLLLSLCSPSEPQLQPLLAPHINKLHLNRNCYAAVVGLLPFLVTFLPLDMS